MICERDGDLDVEGVSEIVGEALTATGDFERDAVADAAGVPDGVPLEEGETVGVPETGGVPEGVAVAVTTTSCDRVGVGETVKTNGVGESAETVGVADAAKDEDASDAFGASGVAEGVAHASTGGQRAPPVTLVTFVVAS